CGPRQNVTSGSDLCRPAVLFDQPAALCGSNARKMAADTPETDGSDPAQYSFHHAPAPPADYPLPAAVHCPGCRAGPYRTATDWSVPAPDPPVSVRWQARC